MSAIPTFVIKRHPTTTTSKNTMSEFELVMYNQYVFFSFIRCYLDTLLSYGQDAKSTIAETGLYFKDQPTTCTQNVKDANDVAVPSGYEKRRLRVKESQIVPFGTDLHIDFLTCPRWLPPGVPMRMKFIRNDDNFVIISNGGEYKIKLLELFIEFRKISPDTAVTKRELTALENGSPYRMPFYSTRFLMHTVPAARKSFSISNLMTGKLPQQIFLVFVKHSSYNSDLKKNGFIFENLKIQHLVWKVNGRSEPSTPYTPKFDVKPINCVREYQHLMNSIGIKRLNSGLDITMEDFASNCCIWVLDMNPEQCNNSTLIKCFVL